MARSSGFDDPDTEARVRRNLKKFREEVGLSVEEVAARLAGTMSSTTVFRVETGERPLPSPLLLKRLVEIYGHELDHLWDKNPPPSDPGRMPVLGPMQLLVGEEDAKLIADDLATIRKQWALWDEDLRAKLKQRRRKRQ